METARRTLRLIRRGSYWLERLEHALARGDLRDAAAAQARLRALGWSVTPRPPRICPLAPRDVDHDLRAESERDGCTQSESSGARPEVQP